MPKPSSDTPPAGSIARIVQKKEKAVHALCREFHVEELYLFGSAASGDFKRFSSDIDLLVRFKSSTPSDHADRYFGLLAGLRDLFRRRIDLVELDAMKNPYFRESAESNRTLIYAAHA